MSDHKHQFTEVEGDSMECPCGVTLGIIYEDEGPLDFLASLNDLDGGEPYEEGTRRSKTHC